MREQIFDVGHHAAVKAKLRALLTSELVPVSEMHHISTSDAKTIEEEGSKNIVYAQTVMLIYPFIYTQLVAMLAIG